MTLDLYCVGSFRVRCVCRDFSFAVSAILSIDMLADRMYASAHNGDDALACCLYHNYQYTVTYSIDVSPMFNKASVFLNIAYHDTVNNVTITTIIPAVMSPTTVDITFVNIALMYSTPVSMYFIV